MKKIIVLIYLGISLLLSSCTTYYYSILETTNYNSEYVENGDFLFQNDSLWIAYNFGGYHTPIRVTVYNKLDVPLYIDWTKSALIIDNVAQPYVGENTSFFGSQIEESIRTHHNKTISYKEFDGIIKDTETTSYVFPQTMVNKEFMNVYMDYSEIKNVEYENIQLPNKYAVKKAAKKVDFESNNTPLKFKSYLTMYYNANQPIIHQSEFYLAALIKTSDISPNNLPDNMADKGNISYYEKTNNTGWYIVGGVAAAVVIIPVAITAGSDPDFNHDW